MFFFSKNFPTHSEIKIPVFSVQNTEVRQVSLLRNETVKKLFVKVLENNIFDRRQFKIAMNQVLKAHQMDVVKIFKHGNTKHSPPLKKVLKTTLKDMRNVLWKKSGASQLR